MAFDFETVLEIKKKYYIDIDQLFQSNAKYETLIMNGI